MADDKIKLGDLGFSNLPLDAAAQLRIKEALTKSISEELIKGGHNPKALFGDGSVMG